MFGDRIRSQFSRAIYTFHVMSDEDGGTTMEFGLVCEFNTGMAR